MGPRLAIRYPGVLIVEATLLLGDNGSVVASESLPHPTLRQRHHAPTRGAVASPNLHFIVLHLIPADIMSKH